jgi:hypothetical protein
MAAPVALKVTGGMIFGIMGAGREQPDAPNAKSRGARGHPSGDFIPSGPGVRLQIPLGPDGLNVGGALRPDMMLSLPVKSGHKAPLTFPSSSCAGDFEDVT